MSNFIYNLNGDVLVFGDNRYGQLGLCHNKNINIPTLLMNDTTIRNIICGKFHPRLPKVTRLTILIQ